MIRLILAGIAIFFFLIFCIILIPIEWIIGKFSPAAVDKSRLKIVQGFLRILLFICGTRMTVIGRDRIPKDTAVLYAINHRSMFDILVTLTWWPTVTGYVSKKEYEKVPLLSWWIRWLHGLFLDRENLRQGLKVILAAIENVKSGISMAIFPEGTRNRGSDEGELLPFHEGSFKIATKAGCPIVPVALCHTSQAFEDHIPWLKATHVILEYGEPIYPSKLTREEKKFIGKKVRQIVAEMIAKNR